MVLLLLWLLLLVMVYKVLSADKDYEEYDPFEILQLDPVGRFCTQVVVVFATERPFTMHKVGPPKLMWTLWGHS